MFFMFVICLKGMFVVRPGTCWECKVLTSVFIILLQWTETLTPGDATVITGFMDGSYLLLH